MFARRSAVLGDKDRTPSQRVSPDLKNGTARTIRRSGGATITPILPRHARNVSTNRPTRPDRREDRACELLTLILGSSCIEADARAGLIGKERTGFDKT